MKRYKVWYITDRDSKKRFLETYGKDTEDAYNRVMKANHHVAGFDIKDIEQVTKIKGG